MQIGVLIPSFQNNFTHFIVGSLPRQQPDKLYTNPLGSDAMNLDSPTLFGEVALNCNGNSAPDAYTPCDCRTPAQALLSRVRCS